MTTRATDVRRELRKILWLDHAPDPEVGERLKRSGKNGGGAAEPSRLNALYVLREDPRWANRLAFNEFTHEVNLDGVPIDDDDVTTIHMWLDQVYDLRIEPQALAGALSVAAKYRSFHPIRDYLQELVWDGEPRLNGLLAQYCGCDETELNALISRRFAISAVARIMEPGCKVDTTLVLAGKQGYFKSTAAKVLFGSDYVRDTPLNVGDKDSFAALRGVWCYEIAELQSFKGRDATAVKSYISSPEDYYRPAFERLHRRVPRQVVFFCTTNDDEFLDDPTGHRRYLCASVRRLADLDAIRRDRDQLWAEAVEAWIAGEHWHFTREEVERLTDSNKRFEVSDGWDDIISDYCKWKAYVTATEIATGPLKMEPIHITRSVQMRITAVLKRLGAERDDNYRPVRWKLPN